MDLRTRLADDLKSAMKARDTVRTETIRGVRAAVMNREVETGTTLDDDGIMQVIVALSKQRADSIEQYQAGGRADLVERETREKALLEAYLPAAPPASEIEAIAHQVVEALGAQGMKDMGRVMKACKDRLGPGVDGKTLSGIVKSVLTSAIVLMLACAGHQASASPQEWQVRLRAAMGGEVTTRQERDDNSRLLAEAVDDGALDGLNRDQVRAALGPGVPCVAPRVCTEQGFGANDWYYEIGVMGGSDVHQLPLLLVGFDQKGIVSRLWTLTTH